MNKPFVLALALLLCVSCSENAGDGPRPTPPGERETIEAILPVEDAFADANEGATGDDRPLTRTIIVGDGGLDKARWSERDEVLVWATPDAGTTYPLDAAKFTYLTPQQGTALFTGTIPVMEETTYTYYGAYPIPSLTEGRKVTYTLPAEQDGTYNGALDIMLSAPASGGRLTESGAAGFSLAFAHKCHILRIQVPEGRNLFGEPITRLRLEFPTEVVGTLTYDVTAPDAEPAFTGGSRTVTLDLRRPLDESAEDAPDGNYVWVFLRGGVAVEGELRFTAYTAKGYQSQTLATRVSKTFAAGRITPLTLTVPQELPVASIDFSIGANNLGEAPVAFTVTAPDGATLRNGTASHTFTVNDQNKYTLEYYEAIDGRDNGNLLRTGQTNISFESENAIVPAQFTIGSNAAVSLTVPYLMFEDFSGVTGEYGSNDSKGLMNYDADYIDAYGIPGWTISRARVNKYALCLRHYVAWGADYYARINSAPLTYIKPGKSVKIAVAFNGASDSKNISCIVGSYDSTKKRNPGTGDDIETVSTTITIAENTTYAGYDKLTQNAPLYNFMVNHADLNTCLAWKTNADLSGGFTGSYHNTYIDNIKVQITK